jgi:hypothetical protein
VPLNSTQQHCVKILDGLPIPGGTQTLQAFITPPMNKKLDGPLAFVWGGRMTAARLAMPRGMGFKKLTWSMDAYLAYETNPNVDELDQQFPLICDAVMAALWTTPMPVPITDPTTGVVSQLDSIGEQFTFEYPPVKAPKTQRMYYFAAKFSFQLQELPQA